MVTNQKETSPGKRQNDDDVRTPEVNNPVPQEVSVDIGTETEEKRTKRNEEGDLDELMQEVGLDVNCEEETYDQPHEEENIDEGEEREEEQEQTEEDSNIENIGM